MASELYDRIYTVVRALPIGQVASYSQVAKAVGMPRGVRVVGWAMGALRQGTDVPWWRVVNAKGQLSIVNKNVSSETQRYELEQEGVSCVWRDGMYEVLEPVWWTPAPQDEIRGQ